MSSAEFKSLKDKVVLITAGGSGIGWAMAESFLAQGALVHICDLSNALLDECQKEHPTLTYSLCDVSKSNQVEAMFAQLQGIHGRLDILVNNAGVAGPTAALEDIEIEDWEKTLAVDITGSFMVARLAVPMLKKSNGGSIINMSSSAGILGVPLRSPYVASKWAIIGLTKTWAMELGRFGIRVNAISPGCVEGPRIDSVIERDAAERGMEASEVRDVYQRQCSLRQFVSAQDIANLALFVSSDMGANISGQSLSVDGHTETLANWLD